MFTALPLRVTAEIGRVSRRKDRYPGFVGVMLVVVAKVDRSPDRVPSTAGDVKRPPEASAMLAGSAGSCNCCGNGVYVVGIVAENMRLRVELETEFHV